MSPTRSLMALYLMANSSRSARLCASKSSTRDSSCCRMRFSSWRDSSEDMAPATAAAGQRLGSGRLCHGDMALGWGYGPWMGIWFWDGDMAMGWRSGPRVEISLWDGDMCPGWGSGSRMGIAPWDGVLPQDGDMVPWIGTKLQDGDTVPGVGTLPWDGDLAPGWGSHPGMGTQSPDRGMVP